MCIDNNVQYHAVDVKNYMVYASGDSDVVESTGNDPVVHRMVQEERSGGTKTKQRTNTDEKRRDGSGAQHAV